MKTAAVLLAFALAAPGRAAARAPQPSATVLAPAPALQPSAAQRETARTWVLEGRHLFAARDYVAALERYTAAYQLVRVPTVGVEVARAQEALGQWVEANATAVEVINLPREAAEPQVFEQARSAAQDLLRSLTPRIPALQLQLTPASVVARVEIDGEDMPAAGGAMSFKLNPGAHQLRVSAPGYRTELRSATLAEQERQVLQVVLVPELEAALPGSSSAQVASPGLSNVGGANMAERGSGARTRGYVALGVAGVGAVLGSVTGVLAFHYKPDCPGDLCVAQQRDEADRSRRFGNVATVSFGVALVAAAYGGWELLFNAGSEQGESAAASGTRVGLSPLEGGAALQLSGEL